MSKIIITRKNRDGAKIWLEQINNSNEYILNTDKSFVLEHCRIIYDILSDDVEEYDFSWNINNSNIKVKCNALDPSGGPYISIGDVFEEKYKLNRIYTDYENDKLLKFVLKDI